MLNNLILKKFLLLGILASSLFFISTIQAGNPPSFISSEINIIDPGAPTTSWGGCGPLDPNCYIGIVKEVVPLVIKQTEVSTPSVIKTQKQEEPKVAVNTNQEGIPGPRGPQGIQGPRGPAGPQGNSLDPSLFVAKTLFSGQVDRIYDSVGDSLSNKQENLVSGTNIKTINGNTILGSGDLTLSSMVYPDAGIPLSTGTAWGTSITNNSANWNTAYGWGNHASGGYALTSGNLSQFASTTSAQLLGVLSDESGTGNILTTNGSAASLTSFPTFNQNTTGTAAGLSSLLASTSGGSGVNNAGTLTWGAGGTLGTNAYTSTAYAPLASPTFTGTITLGSLTGVLRGDAGVVSIDTDITDLVDNLSYLKLADGTDGNLITWDAAGAPALVSTGTSGQLLTSNGTGTAPTFQDAPSGMVYPGVGIPLSTGSAWGTSITDSSALASNISDETGTGVIVLNNSPTFVDDVTIGTTGSSTGSLMMKGSTSGEVILKTNDTAGTYTLTLPTSAGSVNQFLKTDGNGNLSWADLSLVASSVTEDWSGNVQQAITNLRNQLGQIIPLVQKLSDIDVGALINVEASGSNYVLSGVNTTGNLLTNTIAPEIISFSYFDSIQFKVSNGTSTDPAPVQAEIYGDADGYATALNGTTKFTIDPLNPIIKFKRTDTTKVAGSNNQTTWTLTSAGDMETLSGSAHGTILAQEVGVGSITTIEKSTNGLFTDTVVLTEDVDYVIDSSNRKSTVITLTSGTGIVSSQSKLRITWVADVAKTENTVNNAILKVKFYLNRTSSGETSPSVQQLSIGTSKYVFLKVLQSNQGMTYASWSNLAVIDAVNVLNSISVDMAASYLDLLSVDNITKAIQILDHVNMTVDRASLIMDNANLITAHAVSIIDNNNLSLSKAISIFDNANITAAKVSAIANTAGMSSTKIFDIFNSGSLTSLDKIAALMNSTYITADQAANYVNSGTDALMASLLNSVYFTASEVATILINTNVLLSKEVSILSHVNLTADKAQSILRSMTDYSHIIDIITSGASDTTIASPASLGSTTRYNTLTNNSTLTLNASQTNVLIANTFTNSGTVTKTDTSTNAGGGTIIIAKNFVNSNSITANGGGTSSTGSAGSVFRIGTDAVGRGGDGGNGWASVTGVGNHNGGGGGGGYTASASPGGTTNYITNNTSADAYFLLRNATIDWYLENVTSKTPTSSQSFPSIYGSAGGNRGYYNNLYYGGYGGSGGGSVIVLADIFDNTGGTITTNGSNGSSSGASLDGGGGGGGGGLIYGIYRTTLTAVGTLTSAGGAGGGGTRPGDAGATGITKTYSVSGADLAENYPTQDSSIEAGDLVRIKSNSFIGKIGEFLLGTDYSSEKYLVEKTNKEYDPQMMGVVSTNPAIVLGDKNQDNLRAIGLSGRVPVKVTTQNGPITVGDYLTSSNIPGVAMKAIKSGRVIGLAMENYSGNEIGKVMTFINLTYADDVSNVNSIPEEVPVVEIPETLDNSILGNSLEEKQTPLIDENELFSISTVEDILIGLTPESIDYIDNQNDLINTKPSTDIAVKLRKNITTLDNIPVELSNGTIVPTTILGKMLSLTAVSYNWISEEDTDKKHVGFITNEIELLFPGIISIDLTTGIKSISYMDLIPYSIQAIKEMNLKILGIDDMEIENSFRSVLISWFGNVSNGITEFVSGILRAKNKLCIGEGDEEVCITKEELLQIKTRANITAEVITPDPVAPEEIPPSAPLPEETPPALEETTPEPQEEEPAVEESPEELPLPLELTDPQVDPTSNGTSSIPEAIVEPEPLPETSPAGDEAGETPASPVEEPVVEESPEEIPPSVSLPEETPPAPET